MGKRKDRSPEEQERRAKIRELLQLSGVSSIHAQLAVYFAQRMPD